MGVLQMLIFFFLEEKLAEEWRKIQQDWFLGLVRKRLEYVISVNGAATPY